MAASLGAAAFLSLFSSSSSSLKLFCLSKPSHSVELHISFSTRTLSLNCPLSRSPSLSNKNLGLELCCAVQEIVLEETIEDKRKKLFVANLPWSLSIADIKSLLGECGTVKDVEILKQKDGRKRGFAFVTMASRDEALAVIDKFDARELSGRIIRVEFANSLKKPSPPAAGIFDVETRHKLYVSNLAWKTRSRHLREFFSGSFNPSSAKVVFNRPSGNSAGYGFVSLASKEEAEAAISALDGKELLGRPIRLKYIQKNVDESGSNPEENTKDQPEEASSAIEKPKEL